MTLLRQVKLNKQDNSLAVNGQSLPLTEEGAAITAIKADVSLEGEAERSEALTAVLHEHRPTSCQQILRLLC